MVSDQVCYYLGSRYYLPELGRFLNADFYVDTGTGVNGTNMFAYCNNDSVNKFDPNGYWGADIHYGKTSKYRNSITRKFKNALGLYPDYDGTYEWLLEIGVSKNVSAQIAEACRTVDLSFLYGPIWPWGWGYHFNFGGKKDTRLKNASRLLDEAVKDYKQGKTEQAYKKLGRGLHALQDTYAHGNFFPVIIFTGLDGKEATTITFHSAEYDNPFYDWNIEDENFKPIGNDLGKRYADTKDATQIYVFFFILRTQYL